MDQETDYTYVLYVLELEIKIVSYLLKLSILNISMFYYQIYRSFHASQTEDHADNCLCLKPNTPNNQTYRRIITRKTNQTHPFLSFFGVLIKLRNRKNVKNWLEELNVFVCALFCWLVFSYLKIFQLFYFEW